LDVADKEIFPIRLEGEEMSKDILGVFPELHETYGDDIKVALHL